MKKIFLLFFAFSISSFSWGQKYFTKTGHISFFSKTSIENIEAHNQQASCLINFSNGDLQFQALMKGFQFEKALMQEHFNENYVESATYPKATFKGKINNLKDININKEGTYTAQVSGDLTLHGVSKTITTPATIEVKGGKIHAKTKFKVKPVDFKIKIPVAVRSNIAETIEVSVDALCNPYEK
jgi:hypothetical protein